MDALLEIRALVRQGRYRTALDECDRLLARSPDNVDVVIEKAQILALPLPDIARPQEAVDLLQRAIAKSPWVAELHLALGFVFDLGLCEYEKALGEYRECLRLAPDNPRCHLAMARLCDAPGVVLAIEEALQHASQAVTAAPGAWEARRELAKLNWMSGDLSEALQQLRAALAAQPPPDEGSADQMERWIEALDKGQTFQRGYLQGSVRRSPS
jgi:tetratricopeptide (TPR) repeat protein